MKRIYGNNNKKKGHLLLSSDNDQKFWFPQHEEQEQFIIASFCTKQAIARLTAKDEMCDLVSSRTHTWIPGSIIQ